MAEKKLTWNQLARRVWKRPEWIQGDGRWASVAHCGVVTVILYKTQAEAQKAKAFIDGGGCGHACYNDHAVVDLELVREMVDRGNI